MKIAVMVGLNAGFELIFEILDFFGVLEAIIVDEKTVAAVVEKGNCAVAIEN